MFTSLPLLVGENFSILGAHLSSLLYIGYLKSKSLENMMEGVVNCLLGKILWSAPILLEWQQGLVVVAVDVADQQSWPSCLS